MRLVLSRNLLICCLIGGVLMVVAGLVLGYKVFPTLVEKKVWEQTVLKQNTTQWDNFMKIPFPFYYKIYFFNVENAADVMQGAQPIVKEMGPYVYKAYRWRGDVSWEHEDEISFYEYLGFEFDQSSSGALKETDTVTVLNSALLAFLLTVEETAPDALGTINEELEGIFNANSELFMTVKVRDLLFDGVPICSNGGEGGSFATKMICKQVKEKSSVNKPMREVDNTILFAQLYYKNYTHLGRFTIKSGLKEKEEVAHLIKYENKTYIDNWKGGLSLCNKVRGVISFPPFITKDMEFDSFGEDICMFMSLNYVETVTVKGIEGYKFAAKNDSLNAPVEKTDNYCYCLNKSKNMDGSAGCLGNGLMDMSTCMGAPILVSFPHLLYADKVYLDSVKGFSPNETIHQNYVVLEPHTGAPLKAAKRVQFNMFVKPIEDITHLENISHGLIPMLWLEETVDLPDDLTNMIQHELLDKLTILWYMQWGMIILGIVTALSALILLFKAEK